jgi:hypothetical protein
MEAIARSFSPELNTEAICISPKVVNDPLLYPEIDIISSVSELPIVLFSPILFPSKNHCPRVPFFENESGLGLFCTVKRAPVDTEYVPVDNAV